MSSFTYYLLKQLEAHANQRKGLELKTLLKTSQYFYGVVASQRRAMVSRAIVKNPILSEAAFIKTVRELWRGVSREEMYLALEVASQQLKFRTETTFPLFVELAEQASNWDTLDNIAQRFIGERVEANRNHEALLKRWISSRNVWLRRASLLAHMHHKTRTHQAFLGESVLALANDKEIYVRNAISWVLRHYSRTNPDWVSAFVKQHHDKLTLGCRNQSLRYITQKKAAS